MISVLRNNKGDLIHAQAEDVGIATNTEAVIMAILEAIRYCSTHMVQNVLLETDSQFKEHTTGCVESNLGNCRTGGGNKRNHGHSQCTNHTRLEKETNWQIS